MRAKLSKLFFLHNLNFLLYHHFIAFFIFFLRFLLFFFILVLCPNFCLFFLKGYQLCLYIFFSRCLLFFFLFIQMEVLMMYVFTLSVTFGFWVFLFVQLPKHVKFISSKKIHEVHFAIQIKELIELKLIVCFVNLQN